MSKTGTILDYMGEAQGVIGDGTLEPFKPGRPSEHEHGVVYYAPWDTLADGFSEHSRRTALALQKAGKNVHLRTFGARMFIARSDEELVVDRAMSHLTNASIKTYDVQIFQFVPTDEKLQSHVVHKFWGPDELAAINATKIIYNVWERQSVSSAVVYCLNQMARVWVACEDNRQMLKRCGVKGEKIWVIPVPFREDEPLLRIRSQERVSGPVRFYHIGKWEPRKEQRNILGAFLMAFKPGDAKIYLRSSELRTKIEDYPQSPEVCVHEWMKNEDVQANGWSIEKANQDIFLVKKRLTDQQIHQLHRMGDVYVTMSRGEGFDMPAFDAKLAGNLMVYVPSGGPQDFASPDDLVIPTRGETKCHPLYGWGESVYLDYEIEDAVTAMRKARDAVLVGRKREQSLGRLERFTEKCVGISMSACVDEVIASYMKPVGERDAT
jgi:glycosyltransferase involved in cell wall biosynthesis